MIVYTHSGGIVARTESEIMGDIVEVYCSLSPENLSCDGMLSRSEIQKKYTSLDKRLKTLLKELGREVSESEAFGYGE